MNFFCNFILFTLMKTAGPFSESSARFSVACVVEALDYLHNIDIIHRDVKPENMLLAASGYIKLADWVGFYFCDFFCSAEFCSMKLQYSIMFRLI